MSLTTKNTLYGPYKSKQAALDATQNKNGAFGVTIKQRYRGLTIGILNDNNHIDEYWFKDGIEDLHLIKKNVEDITELKLDGNKIEKTTFLFSSDLENSESPLMSKINIQISENIQNDTNLQNRVNEAVENSIQNSDTITNAIILGIQGNSTITKFNNLLDGENIKLDALPTALRELPNNFENGVIKDSVLPTGLQKFTSKLSNDGKLATLDVLPTGVITTDNIKDNDIVKGLQGKFDSNGKLVNTVLPTGLQKFTGNLSNDGKINSLDILPTTELTNSILTIDNINSKLPQGIKDFTEKLTNDGKLDIKNLVDGTTPITTDTFAKKAELSSLSTEFTNLSTVVITTDNIKDNDIVKGLQSKFDSNGNLVNTFLPNDVVTGTNISNKLPNTLVHQDTLDTRLASKADSSDLTNLQNIAITTNNFNSKIPTGLQKFTSKLDDNGDLDLINLKLNGNVITKDTLALSTDIPTVQKLLEDETLVSSINEKITDKMQGEEFEGIVNNAISKSSSLQGIVQNGIDNNGIVKGLQSKFGSDGKLVNTVLPTGLQKFTGKLDDNGNINSLDILPSTIALKTDLTGLQSMVSGLEGTMIGLQSTVASKADSSALTSLQEIAITTENIKDNDIVKGLQSKFGSDGKLNVNNLTLPDTVITKDILDNAGFAKETALTSLNTTVSGLETTVNTKVTELNKSLAKKADSSALSSLQKSVGTLNSRTLSNKTGFVNIENNNISQSNLDLIYNSISDARISSDEVTMKLNPMETGYYYFILNNSNEIININDTLKANLDENEAYNFVFIDGTNKNVTEYYYTLNISEIFEKLNFIYNADDTENTFSQIYSSENMFDVLLDKLQELGLNQQYNYLSELRENIKIIDDGSRRKGVADTKFYDLSLKWPEISQVLQKYNKTEYYLTIKDKEGNLYDGFITIFNTNSDFKNFNNSYLITNFIEFINTEITSHDSQFYQYLLRNITNIKTNDLFKCYTLFTFNKNNQIECQDITILRLTIDYLINNFTKGGIDEIIDTYEKYFNVNSKEYFYNFAEIQEYYGDYLLAFYDILININKYSKKYYVITKTFDDTLLNMKLSNVLNINLLYQVNSPWDGYINSVNTIKYENINNGSVSQYIVDDNNNIIELPYKFKKDSDDELINWLNTYKIKCDSYSTSHDENELIYFGSEYDIDVLINSYTYHIIPNAFQTNDKGYDLKYLTIDDVKNYINNLSEEEKVKKIFLALIEDNGYQYLFEQYVLNGEVLMTFQEYYIVQYATSFISQLVNTGGVTVGGKQFNFAKSDDVSNLTINSETNMEVVAQLVNGLIEDLTLIAQKVSLTDNEKANLSVIDLTGTTGKLTYDVTSGTYKSVKIEGNTPINPRPVTRL